jgi:DNA-binding NarL/FixJ family response regulator
VGTVSSTEAARIGLVHPLRAWLDALEGALGPETGIRVVVAHTDPGWVLQAVERADVDAVLLCLPPSGGPALVRAMRRARADVGVVVISDSVDAGVIAEVVRAGARGWVQSTSGLEHLVSVVRGVLRGESWFPPLLTTLLVDRLLETEQSQQEQSSALSVLSAREREILECLRQGMTRPEIAEQLFLSPHTVRTHINNMLRKLRVHSTLAAVSLARGAPSLDAGQVNGDRAEDGSTGEAGRQLGVDPLA